MNIVKKKKKYTKDFAFVHQYGDAVTDLIDCKPGTKVLDVGCGNGALSYKLQEKGFSVTGLDSSEDLLQIAWHNYPEVNFVKADAVSFSLDETFDAVFSNAVFHWIDAKDQDCLLKSIFKVLKPKGQLVFEMGGSGNNALIHRQLANIFTQKGYAYKNPFYFPSIGEYALRLEKCGFKVQFAVLFDRFTELKGKDGLSDWIRMFVKQPFEQISSLVEREEIIRTVVRNLEVKLYVNGKWHADYVRLQMKACKCVD